ncbi:hypothetical protein [Spirochaeta isovalerica]|uniref:Uncharacterized protein n=1 Tax=Spirochaeta isovalerica TaxID=150 RepID=A0A841REA5_9SPIO|nr:hypothetical protein [Spirochaeta isovalerica]MBB6481547.1 hypothetical protein [Spirochaeta isovalerica]
MSIDKRVASEALINNISERIEVNKSQIHGYTNCILFLDALYKNSYELYPLIFDGEPIDTPVMEQFDEALLSTVVFLSKHIKDFLDVDLYYG